MNAQPLTVPERRQGTWPQAQRRRCFFLAELKSPEQWRTNRDARGTHAAQGDDNLPTPQRLHKTAKMEVELRLASRKASGQTGQRQFAGFAIRSFEHPESGQAAESTIRRATTSLLHKTHPLY